MLWQPLLSETRRVVMQVLNPSVEFLGLSSLLVMCLALQWAARQPANPAGRRAEGFQHKGSADRALPEVSQNWLNFWWAVGESRSSN